MQFVKMSTTFIQHSVLWGKTYVYEYKLIQLWLLHRIAFAFRSADFAADATQSSKTCLKHEGQTKQTSTSMSMLF